MPSIRIGYSSEFVLRNELVGIGSTATSERLDVAGQIRSENTAGSGGVSTFREYQGFSQVEANVTNNITIDNGSGGPYSSLTGEIKITGETTVSSGSTVEVGKTKTLTVTDRFAVPLGETNNRDNAPEAGTTRFNQDFGTLEFFDGANWKTVNSYARYHGGAAGRVVFGGGYVNPSIRVNTLEYVNINTLGNSQYFGDLLGRISFCQSCGSETRGLYAGDSNPSPTSPIEYITIASAGNSIDFGDLSAKAEQPGGSCSSSTRGIWGGRSPSPGAQSNVIDYVQISTLGNALDFGDLKDPSWGTAAVGSTVRGVFISGSTPSPGYTGELTYITIASKGNAVRFGDLTHRRMTPARGSNSSGRGVIAGGSSVKTIDYIKISTEGNATYFGDLSENLNNAASCGVSGRMIRLGGTTPSNTNIIDYVVISTMGNALNFGDISQFRSQADGTSDSHGGLGGF